MRLHREQRYEQDARLRRAIPARAKIRQLKAMRLSVHRTPQHIYAQIFDSNSKVLALRRRCRRTCAKA
jgi:large subunit ribosomal protein L18